MKNENLVKITGKVVHVYSYNQVTILSIRTIYGSKVPNYPQVKFYGELAAKAALIEVGDTVAVEGHYVSRMNIVDDRNTYKQEIIGRMVEKQEDETKNYLNEVSLSGKIVKLTECREGVIMMVIKTRFKKYVNNIMAFIYPGDIKEILDNYQVNDIVRVKGNIQTKKRVYPDITRYYQDLTLREIEIIKRNDVEE